ncbi:MAG TPA: DUF2911 domain-containing protein [Candidatus Acidoferrales bacterium]|nr:DUF2911 domain-containing protein [Candidatus Acidoferrales bacterium]
MNTKLLPLFVLLAGGFLSADTVSAQPGPTVDFPAPSPACTIKQRVGLTDIEVVYSRPGMKGREIFGSLVPYDKVWRTGANSATKVTFSTAVKLEGHEIPAGSYALFTIPGADEWTVIINKNVNQWGAYTYDEKADLVRFTVNPVQLSEHIETFTIEFNRLADESALMDLIWDQTVVPIKVEVDVASKLVPQIEAVMASDAKQKPYYPAAMFYYNHNLDLHKASEWVDAAITNREAHYIVYLKAEILAKLGDKEGAIAAAKRSSELAVKANDPGYVKMNDDLISSLK